MAIIKNCTDLKQSRKLAEFLSIESADMYWRSLNINGHISWTSHIKRLEPPIYDLEHYIPCWSLAALLNLLPADKIITMGITIEDNKKIFSVGYMDKQRMYKSENENMVDACVEMIIKLHEMNLL